MSGAPALAGYGIWGTLLAATFCVWYIDQLSGSCLVPMPTRLALLSILVGIFLAQAESEVISVCLF